MVAMVLTAYVRVAAVIGIVALCGDDGGHGFWMVVVVVVVGYYCWCSCGGGSGESLLKRRSTKTNK